MPISICLTRGSTDHIFDDATLRIVPTERARGNRSAARVLTFPQLARQLAGPVANGVLPDEHQRLLLDRMLDELVSRHELPAYGSLVGRPGFGEAVFSLVSELRGLGVDAATWLASGNEAFATVRPKDRDIATILVAYADLLDRHQWLDRASVYARAIERLGRRLPARFAAIRRLDIVGFSEFTPPQHKLIEGLARRISEVRITLPGDGGNDELFQVANDTATRFGNVAISVVTDQSPGPAGLQHLRENLFRHDLSISNDATGLSLIEGPGEVGEVRLAVRAIKALILDGTAPGSVLVSVRHLSGYVALFRELFAEYGVPIEMDGTDSLAELPAVATLLAAAGLAEADFPFAGTADLLRSTWLAPTWPDWIEQPDVATEAELLLRLLGEPRGREHFLRATAQHAATLVPGLEDEGAEESLRRRRHDLAKRCEPFLIRFFDVWKDVPDRVPFAEHVTWLKHFADDLGIAPLDQLWDELDQWSSREGSLHPDARRYSQAEFLALAGSLAAGSGVPRETGPGRVRIVPAELAIGLTYEHLFLLGLGERSFPAGPGAHPLYDEAERQALAGTNVELSLASGQLPSEMLLYYRLITGATKSVTLAYPAVDAKGQQLLPGSFLLATQRLFETILTTRRRMSIEGLDTDEPLSLAEYRIRCAVTGDTPLTADLAEHLAAAQRMAEARFRGDEFGSYDGVLTSKAAKAVVAERFGPSKQYSPTALEQYIACPFRFFAGQVLRLVELDEPADEMEHHSRGVVYHRALARVHRRQTNQDEVADELAREIAIAVGEEAGRVSSPAMKVLWRLEEERLQRLAKRYAGQWAAYRDPWIEARCVPVPERLEGDFQLALGDVRLHGRIDRIDFVDLPGGGRGAIVIDYKTGSGGKFTGNAVRRLEKVQLPIYALAVEELEARPLGMTYWILGEGGAKAILPGKKSTAWLDELEPWTVLRVQLVGWLDTLTRQIRAGNFPLAPRTESSCEHCAFGQSCRIAGGGGRDKDWDLPLPGDGGEQ